MSVTHIPDALRADVIDRDGSLCLRCGVQCTWAGPTRLHIDHVISEARGGLTTFENLQVLCARCNESKGAKTVDYRTDEARAAVAEREEQKRRRRADDTAWIESQEAARWATRARVADLRSRWGWKPIGEKDGWVVSWKSGKGWTCTCGAGNNLRETVNQQVVTEVGYHLLHSPRHLERRPPHWPGLRPSVSGDLR